MRTEERTRGVRLRVLDFSGFGDEALKVYNDRQDRLGEPHDFEVMEPAHSPYAAAEHGGHLYVVCNEGVGWEVDDEHPLELDLYGSTANTFSIMPSMLVRLTPDEIRARMTDEIDLADLIRQFGARLEDNFWLWHHTLTK